MAVTLTLTGKTPGQSQFGLAEFTEHYKCNATADDVLTDPSVPQQGDAHPDYAFMFVTDRYVVETGESASILDLKYMGCLTDDGDGNPILPPQQNATEMQLQSASSSKSAGGATVTSPITVQYYAPSATLNYISFGAPGTDSAPTPTAQLVVLTITCGDTSFSGESTPALITGWFSPLIVDNNTSTEIVAGQFWSNTARRTNILSPFLVIVPAGPYLSLYNPGGGYSPADTLTISSGGESATVVVDTVGSIFGTGDGILSWHTTSNTFTVAHTALAATGGSGTGAAFNVFIIP